MLTPIQIGNLAALVVGWVVITLSSVATLLTIVSFFVSVAFEEWERFRYNQRRLDGPYGTIDPDLLKPGRGLTHPSRDGGPY